MGKRAVLLVSVSYLSVILKRGSLNSRILAAKLNTGTIDSHDDGYTILSILTDAFLKQSSSGQSSPMKPNCNLSLSSNPTSDLTT
jgi:hypothetical protein